MRKLFYPSMKTRVSPPSALALVWVIATHAFCCTLLLGCSKNQGQFASIPSNYSIRTDPITISMYEGGGGLISGDWNLSVNSAGEAQLTVFSQPTDKTVNTKVSSDQLDKLRQLLVRERFFELDDDYGEIVLDSGLQAITVTVGEFSKTVRIHYLMNWVNHEPAKLRDPARAVRVGMAIRDWFDDPDAVDSRAYDQKVLDVVGD
jgi:hypothetical protein